MYLVIAKVSGEHTKRFHEVETREEAKEYIQKLSNYAKIRYNAKVQAKVYPLPEPAETFE